MGNKLCIHCQDALQTDLEVALTAKSGKIEPRLRANLERLWDKLTDEHRSELDAVRLALQRRVMSMEDNLKAVKAAAQERETNMKALIAELQRQNESLQIQYEDMEAGLSGRVEELTEELLTVRSQSEQTIAELQGKAHELTEQHIALQTSTGLAQAITVDKTNALSDKIEVLGFEKKCLEVQVEELDRRQRIESPLHQAARTNNFTAAKVLLAENAVGVDLLNAIGYSALHVGALSGHVEILKILLENKATVELQDDEGNTPLHLAAQHGRTDTIALLIWGLPKDMDPEIPNKAGETPMQIAEKAQLGYFVRTYEKVRQQKLVKERENQGLVFLKERLDELGITGYDIKGVAACRVTATASFDKGVPMALKLDKCLILDEGAIGVAKFLSTTTTLQNLSLISNDISDPGAIALAGALVDNPYLHRLSLWNNRVEDEGATAIAKALQSNAALLELNLVSNQVGNLGAAQLGNALQGNYSLRVLHLGRNLISDSGAEELAKGIEQNDSLEKLSLEWNNLSDRGAAALTSALETNTALVYLSFYGNPKISAPQKEALLAMGTEKRRVL
ncbi:hypothetical protein CYMTET_23674 [Cymbomonas tetramitiformis]|uniref:Uncharacterized protein n=1 Tax=Cymbomonas tetramitiformis TaxID=36881 RepID=A0AAE0FY11_9CHLO|nr:hypothetical protein CYMTET_23674 [Cymbomonas tetramitiformis]